MNRKLLFLTTALITGFAIVPAQAGFEWNPPPVKAQAPSPSAQAPDESSGTGPLTPMPGDTMATARVEPVMAADIMDNAPPVARVTSTQQPGQQPGMRTIGNAPVNLEGQNIESDVMLPVPGEMAQSPVVAASPAATVEGFGKDIPLALALRQVVPPVYAISYETGVDQGKPVTWNGGSAWTNVVSDMLENRKLHATMQGNNITISNGTGPALQMQSAPPAMADNSPILYSGGPKPVIDMAMQKHWTAQAGQSLRQTLQDWSGQAKVELAWQNANDSPIASAFSYDGTFDQAVDALLSLYSGGANEPQGKLYPNLPEGPSVLVIGAN